MGTRTSEEWLRDLQSDGGTQASALTDLRDYLLRAALYSYQKNRALVTSLGRAEIEQLAEDSAQNALLTILQHLRDFRGESKFTTWAYKFAVNIALVSARREQWKRVSLDQLMSDLDSGKIPFEDEDADADPNRAALRDEVWQMLSEVIENDLTDRQRQVLKAIVFEEVPLDEVARYLNSNRNAVYKLLHDARRRLKECLQGRGFELEEILGLFAAQA